MIVGWSQKLALLMLMVTLAGCGGSRVISTPMPIPTFDATPTLREFARTPTPTATRIAETETPRPSATATATRTPTKAPPTETATRPPRTEGSLAVEIYEFSVTPLEGLKPGDEIQASWQADGDSAQICIDAYDYFAAECRRASLTGSTSFTLGNWEGLITVTLSVTSDQGGDHVNDMKQFRLFIPCSNMWVWNSLEGDVRCPFPKETWVGAAQPFEHGWIVWTGKHYYILFDAPSKWEIDGAKRLEEVREPLDLTGDTSGQYRAPEGFYVPESDFGIVWRGDATGSPGFVEALGWAIQPEVRYEAFQQCWSYKNARNGRPTGSISECYFVHPGGGLIAIMRNGVQHYWRVIP